MGLFDQLKKLGSQEIAKVAKDAINNVSKDVLNAIDPNLAKNVETNSATGKDIPAEYGSFPVFRSKADEVSTKDVGNYKRCTMDFYNVPEEEIQSYVSKISTEGYVKGSDVRFDKSNTYIIVDYDKYGKSLNLVYHIKK